MNFKKLFSWKRSAEEQDRALLAAWRANGEAPRPLHYIFAHRLLPQLAYHHGIMAALTLGDPNSEFEYLPRLWEATAQRLTPEDSLAPTGLTGVTQRAGEFRITVLTCPPPERAGEVYFTAIVCGPLPELEEAPFESAPKASKRKYSPRPTITSN
jgi:hypothetical protein